MNGNNALNGVRVLELDNGLAQFAGKILADMGADVIKIEPPEGVLARKIEPFYQDQPDINGSVHFWTYNTSKRSIVLDLSSDEGLKAFHNLAATADVVLDGLGNNIMASYGLDYANLREQFPDIIYSSVTPFGLDGPWASYKSSDIVSMALGGVMSLCGYDEESLPPIAPTGGQTAHIVGAFTVISILAALHYRERTNEGQLIDVSAHDAISVTTEIDTAMWEFRKASVVRQTARHAMQQLTDRWIHLCSDGKYVIILNLYLNDTQFKSLADWFDSQGMAEDLKDDKYLSSSYRKEQMGHILDVIGRFCAQNTSDYIFNEGQERRLPWSPIHAPEDLVDDPQLSIDRKFYQSVEHEDLGESFLYPGDSYGFTETPYRIQRRAPHLGEHTNEILDELGIGSTT